MSADRWEVQHVVYRRPFREYWKVQETAPPHQALLNDRSRLKRFRSAETAQAACDKLNATPGVQGMAPANGWTEGTEVQCGFCQQIKTMGDGCDRENCPCTKEKCGHG